MGCIAFQGLMESGWPQTLYVAKNDFEHLLLLPLLSKRWDYRCVSAHLVYVELEGDPEPQASSASAVLTELCPAVQLCL